jgi:hypothetical protein
MHHLKHKKQSISKKKRKTSSKKNKKRKNSSKKRKTSQKKKKRKVTKFPTATTIAGQRRQVWEGRADMTKSGLKKKDLKVSKTTGKIVSIKASNKAKRMVSPALKRWRDSVKKAAKHNGVPYSPVPRKGTSLYITARKFYDGKM